MAASPALIDRHGRQISYLRVSVTDRCDLRCRYCMAEAMQFLPRDEVLSLDEIAGISERFIARGVRKIRLTGGEPLVRRAVMELVERLGRSLGSGLEELTLTTNATRLAQHAHALAAAGVRRVNISLDSLDPDRFRYITRRGDLTQVLEGIEAARDAGLAIKINMVALAGLNEDEIAPMLHWCGSRGFDLTLIETMPLGETGEDRTARFLPLAPVLEAMIEPFGLVRDLAGTGTASTGGPSRYWRVPAYGTRLGVISPLTGNFCASCNRLRLASDGRLFTCLGHDDQVDLRHAIRSGGIAAVDAAIDAALAGKPERHQFAIRPGAPPALDRHMSVTGG